MSSPFLDSQVVKLPPLRIHHFMAWTVVSAVMFTVMKNAAHGENNAHFFNTGTLPAILVESLALCGLGFGIAWLSRGLPFFDQPGHAAFVGMSLMALFHVAWAVVWSKFVSDNLWRDLSFSWAVWLISYGWYAQLALQIVINVFFAYRFWQRSRWRLFFFLKALAIAAQMLGEMALNFWLSRSPSMGSGDMSFITLMSMIIQLLPELLSLIWLAWVAWKEQRECISCDWTHWLGIMLWFAIWLGQLGQMVWAYLFPPDWISLS